MFELPREQYEAKRADLVAALAGALKESKLTLLLGSGTSQQLIRRSWHEIVNACSTEVASNHADRKSELEPTFTSNSSGEEMFSRMELVRKLCRGDRAYLDLVSAALYIHFVSQNTASAPDLLRAIGALAGASRHGSIKEIISLNFDCSLEWYLGLHGTVTQVVSRWPTVLGNSDVTVYHPHGYLPISPDFGNKSEMIVFDASEVDRQLSKDTPWRQLFKQLIVRRYVLAVGLGGRDYLLRTLLYDAMDDVKKQSDRPLGCWLCTDSVDAATRQQLRTRGFIAPLIDRDEIPGFLTNICQEARQGILTW
jgi:SIR2-like domain